jgi:prepilin-type processing-associated H-X9-DG protein
MFDKGHYGTAGGVPFYCPFYRPFYGMEPSDDWNTPRTDTTPHTYFISYNVYAAQPNAVSWSNALGNNLPPLYRDTEPRLSELPLLFDETNWYGPGYGGYGYVFSLHYYNGANPAGGNAVYGDGHVAWRGWSDMIKVVDAGDFIRYY